jgi:hypothetical protein
MNPGVDREAAMDGASGAEEMQERERAAEARSWEPPSWPSDTWDQRPRTRQRAIGWRGGRAP